VTILGFRDLYLTTLLRFYSTPTLLIGVEYRYCRTGEINWDRCAREGASSCFL